MGKRRNSRTISTLAIFVQSGLFINVMSNNSKQKRGTNVLENATGKNSAYEGSGHKRVRLMTLTCLSEIR